MFIGITAISFLRSRSRSHWTKQYPLSSGSPITTSDDSSLSHSIEISSSVDYKQSGMLEQSDTLLIFGTLMLFNYTDSLHYLRLIKAKVAPLQALTFKTRCDWIMSLMNVFWLLLVIRNHIGIMKRVRIPVFAV